MNRGFGVLVARHASKLVAANFVAQPLSSILPYSPEGKLLASPYSFFQAMHLIREVLRGEGPGCYR